MKLQSLNRKIHYWGAIISALPILIIIVTGVLLQLKKDFAFIQPPTQKGIGAIPEISFEALLKVAQTVPETQIKNWEDIERLDVRPSKGVIKILANNSWEVQIDQRTGAILQVAYRRSDLIETLHDGSWFHDNIKLWVFLPCGIVLLVLWLTGIYLFFFPYLSKMRRAKRN